MSLENERFLSLDKLNEYSDLISAKLQGRLEYKTTLPLRPAGQTERSSWNDIINLNNPSLVGDCYLLQGTGVGDFVEVNGVKYFHGEYIICTNVVDKDDTGTLSADVEIMKFGGSTADIDNKTILDHNDDGTYAQLHTRVGGWLEDTAYTTTFGATASSAGQYVAQIAINPADISKRETGKSKIIYNYSINNGGTITSGTEDLIYVSTNRFQNTTSNSYVQYDGTNSHFGILNPAIVVGSIVEVVATAAEEDPNYYKKIHPIDTDYINVDKSTIIKTMSNGDEVTHIETEIGGNMTNLWTHGSSYTGTVNLVDKEYYQFNTTIHGFYVKDLINFNKLKDGIKYKFTILDADGKEFDTLIGRQRNTVITDNVNGSFTGYLDIMSGTTKYSTISILQTGTDAPPTIHFEGKVYTDKLKDITATSLGFGLDIGDYTAHPIKGEYIPYDNITTVPEVSIVNHNNTIRAKSAIEVAALSTITNPLTETIYRLTAEETISGKKYAKGLYVYDKSGTTPVWISVGGSEVDEKTIRSTTDDGELVPLYTQVGGWKETDYVRKNTGNNWGISETSAGFNISQESNKAHNIWDIIKDGDSIEWTGHFTEGTTSSTFKFVYNASKDQHYTKYLDVTEPAGVTGDIQIHINVGTLDEYYGCSINYSSGTTVYGTADYCDLKFNIANGFDHYIDGEYLNTDNLTIHKVNSNSYSPNIPISTSIGGGYEQHTAYTGMSIYNPKFIETINVSDSVVRIVLATNTYPYYTNGTILKYDSFVLYDTNGKSFTIPAQEYVWDHNENSYMIYRRRNDDTINWTYCLAINYEYTNENLMGYVYSIEINIAKPTDWTVSGRSIGEVEISLSTFKENNLVKPRFLPLDNASVTIGKDKKIATAAGGKVTTKETWYVSKENISYGYWAGDNCSGEIYLKNDKYPLYPVNAFYGITTGKVQVEVLFKNADGQMISRNLNKLIIQTDSYAFRWESDDGLDFIQLSFSKSCIDNPVEQYTSMGRWWTSSAILTRDTNTFESITFHHYIVEKELNAFAMPLASENVNFEKNAIVSKSFISVNELPVIYNDLYNDKLFYLTEDNGGYTKGMYMCKARISTCEWIKTTHDIDEKTILSTDEDGNAAPLHTEIGGYKYQGTVWFPLEPIGVSTAGHLEMSDSNYKDYYVFVNENDLYHTGNTLDFTIQADNGTYYYYNDLPITSVNTDDGTFSNDLCTVKFYADGGEDLAVSVTINDASILDGYIFETRKLIVHQVNKYLYSPIKSEYINVDKISLVNDTSAVGAETGILHAKSAIEVETFSGIASPLTETIYRLTKDGTSGGKKYVKGLYVYDKSTTPASWIPVGGSDIDNVTIVHRSDNESLETIIGGGYDSNIKEFSQEYVSSALNNTEGNYIREGMHFDIDATTIPEAANGGVCYIDFTTEDNTVYHETYYLIDKSNLKFINATDANCVLYFAGSTAYPDGWIFYCKAKSSESKPINNKYTKVTMIFYTINKTSSQFIPIDDKTIINHTDGNIIETAIGGYKEDTEKVLVQKSSYGLLASSYYNNGKYTCEVDNLGINILGKRRDEDWYIKFTFRGTDSTLICENIEIAYDADTGLFGTFNSNAFAYYEIKTVGNSRGATLTMVYQKAYTVDVANVDVKIYSKVNHHVIDSQYLPVDNITTMVSGSGTNNKLKVKHDYSLTEDSTFGLKTTIGGKAIGTWTGTLSNRETSATGDVYGSNRYFDFARNEDKLVTDVNSVYDITSLSKFIITRIYFKYVTSDEVEHIVDLNNIELRPTTSTTIDRGINVKIGSYEGKTWYFHIRYNGRIFTIEDSGGQATGWDATHNTITNVNVQYKVDDFNYTIPSGVVPKDDVAIKSINNKLTTTIGGGDTVATTVIVNKTYTEVPMRVMNSNSYKVLIIKNSGVTSDTFTKDRTYFADVTITYTDGTVQTYSSVPYELYKGGRFYVTNFSIHFCKDGQMFITASNFSKILDATSVVFKVYTTNTRSFVNPKYIKSDGTITYDNGITSLLVNHDASLITDSTLGLKTAFGAQYYPAKSNQVLWNITSTTPYVNGSYSEYVYLRWNGDELWNPAFAPYVYINNGAFNITYGETTESYTYTKATYDGMYGSWGYKYKLDVTDSRGKSFWWVLPNNIGYECTMFITDQTAIEEQSITITHVSPWCSWVLPETYVPGNAKAVPIDNSTVILDTNNNISTAIGGHWGKWHYTSEQIIDIGSSWTFDKSVSPYVINNVPFAKTITPSYFDNFTLNGLSLKVYNGGTTPAGYHQLRSYTITKNDAESLVINASCYNYNGSPETINCIITVDKVNFNNTFKFEAYAGQYTKTKIWAIFTGYSNDIVAMDGKFIPLVTNSGLQKSTDGISIKLNTEATEIGTNGDSGLTITANGVMVKHNVYYGTADPDAANYKVGDIYVKI